MVNLLQSYTGIVRRMVATLDEPSIRAAVEALEAEGWQVTIQPKRSEGGGWSAVFERQKLA